MENKNIKENKKLEERNWCVYLHTNKINNKKYVGMTKNIEKRWKNNGAQYIRQRKDGKYVHPHFAYAILKYGWDNFKHEVLIDNLTQNEASELEKEYIQKFETLNQEKGYNVALGGYTHAGRELTPEERYARGKAFRGKKLPEETKAKMSEATKKYLETHPHPQKGKHKTKEQKEHMSKMMKEKEIHAPYVYICVETGEEYWSSMEAMRQTGIFDASIRRAADGKQRTAGGYHWKKKLKENKK